MDSFAEQLIVKKKDGRDKLLLALIWIATAILLAGGLFLILFTSWGAYLAVLLAALAVAIIWGAKWLSDALYTEYEYSVVNGDLDVDLITGKRKRKRVVQVRAARIDEFLPVTPALSLAAYERVVYAVPSPEEATFYVAYYSKKNGRTAVLLQPDAHVFAELYNGQPRLKQRECERACRAAGISFPAADEPNE